MEPRHRLMILTPFIRETDNQVDRGDLDGAAAKLGTLLYELEAVTEFTADDKLLAKAMLEVAEKMAADCAQVELRVRKVLERAARVQARATLAAAEASGHA